VHYSLITCARSTLHLYTVKWLVCLWWSWRESHPRPLQLFLASSNFYISSILPFTSYVKNYFMFTVLNIGRLVGIRTPIARIWRPASYQLEHESLIYTGVTDGNRTHVILSHIQGHQPLCHRHPCAYYKLERI
jgi:hypothetical protein